MTRYVSFMYNQLYLLICTSAPYQGSHCTGKTGKIVKSNSRQGKHREFEIFGKTQGKYREFENFRIE